MTWGGACRCKPTRRYSARRRSTSSGGTTDGFVCVNALITLLPVHPSAAHSDTLLAPPVRGSLRNGRLSQKQDGLEWTQTAFGIIHQSAGDHHRGKDTKSKVLIRRRRHRQLRDADSPRQRGSLPHYRIH